MDSKRIFKFLKAVAGNNNREWFALHRDEYMSCKSDFEEAVAEIIAGISEFDSNVAHLAPKDCIYRFYRDTRFSSDKSPYKRHFGAYICEGGKKSLRGGYYLHLQPPSPATDSQWEELNGPFMAAGTWYLPPNILREVRMSIVEDLATFREIVEKPQFRKAFPTLGYDLLKTMPKGFPKDFPYPQYLQPRMYSSGCALPIDFFQAPDWLDQVAHRFQAGKPFNDFLNDTIDDYDL